MKNIVRIMLVAFGIITILSAGANAAYLSINAGAENNEIGAGGGKVYNQNGVGGGNELAVGSLLQYIYAGPDGVINPPDTSGNLTGDDELIATKTVGNDSVFLVFSNKVGQFYHNVTKTYATGTPKVYVRAWNASTVGAATYYGDSILLDPSTNPNVPPIPNDVGIPNFATTITKPVIAPVFSRTPATLTFNATEGGSNPANQTVTISNTGTGTLNWNATKGQTWLTINPASGSCPPNSTMTVSVNISGLTAATYKDYINFTSNGGSGSVEVTLNVNPPAPPAPIITSIDWDVTDGTPLTPENENLINKNHVYGTIIITGSNFGADPGNGDRDTDQNRVNIGSVRVPDINPDGGIEVYYWDSGTIVCGVPLQDQFGAYTIAGDLPVTVTAGSQTSNSINILVNPKVYGVNPTSGNVADNVTINGTAFGTNTANISVSFNGVAATPTTASNTTIEVNVPSGATTGQLLVTVNGKDSNTHYDWAPYDQIVFTVEADNTPRVTGIAPAGGEQGQTMNVTISGSNTTWTGDMASAVHFSGSGITVNSATAANSTTINANISIAIGAALGARDVTVDGAGSSVTFNVTSPGTGPKIDAIYPNAAPTGAKVTITGLRFGSSMGRSLVSFDNLSSKVSYQAQVLSWSDTAIEALVPSLATVGSYEVKVITIPSTSGPVTAQESNPANFEVTSKSAGGAATIYPNPFNAGKETVYIGVDSSIILPTNVGIYIFDMTARLVHREVISGNSINWNGVDMNSMIVGDGAYLVRIINEDTKTLLAKGKLLVVKR